MTKTNTQTYPRPTPNHLPAELLVLVGKIAIQSTYVDLFLGQILGVLTGVEETKRAETVHILDTRRKAQQVEKLLKNESKRAHISDAAKRAGELLAERNLVLHAIIAYAKPDDWSNPLYVAVRGKYAGKEVPFSKDTLEPIFRELDAVSQELMAVCSGLGAHELLPSPEKPR
jgi:hypothetical protein